MADAFTLTFTPCCLEEVGATWGAEGSAAVRWQQGPTPPAVFPETGQSVRLLKRGPRLSFLKSSARSRNGARMGKETVLAG